MTAAGLAGLAQFVSRYFSATGADLLLAAGALSLPGLRTGAFWQPATSLFLTTGPAFWTLAASLLTILLTGRPLEAWVGCRHVFQLFFLSGVAGGLGQLGYDHLCGHPDATIAGASAPALAFCLAAACVSPDAAPTRWQPLQVRHLAFGALAFLGVGLLMGHSARQAAGLEIVDALIGALTGCVYIRGLGLGPRETAINPRRLPPPVTPAPPTPAWVPRRSTPPSVLTAPTGTTATAGASVVPRFTARERDMSPREYVSEKIDPILDKILLHGTGSLTEEDRRILAKARDKLAATQKGRRMKDEG